MDKDAMGRALEEVRKGWDSLGPFARTQSGEVMRPMLTLMGMLVDDLAQAKQEREQLAVALAVANDAIRALGGCKGQSCSGGACGTCAGHGLRASMTNQEVQDHFTAAGVLGQRSPLGMPKPSSAPGCKREG